MHFEFDADYLERTRHYVAMIAVSGVLEDARVLKTAQTVNKLGYQVCLYGMNSRDGVRAIEGYPFKIVLLPHPRFEMARVGRWSAGIKAIDYEGFIDIFARYVHDALRQKPPHLLHTHGRAGLAVGARLNEWAEDDSFLWIHDTAESVPGSDLTAERAGAFLRDVEGRYSHIPAALSSPSRMESDTLQSLHSLETEPRVVINAPRCSDFDPCYPKDVRTALGVPEDVPLLIYKGVVKPTRGMYTLVEVLPLLPEVHLAVVTDSSGSYISEVTRAAQETGVYDRLHFHPDVPFYNVTSFLRTATVGVRVPQVHPSAYDLPDELFEYMHAGIPSIVSTNPVVEEFITQHDCGVEFQGDDARSLADAITRVLNRLRSEPSWHQSIKALSQQYCWETQEPVIAGIYETLGHRRSNTGHPSHEQKSYRVLYLPTAGASQPGALANAMKKRGVSASSLIVYRSKFQFDVDHVVEKVPNDLLAVRQLLHELIEEYDVFHFLGRPLLYSYHLPYPTAMDLILLRAAGKKVFLHFRGPEARLASVYEGCTPYNYVRDDPGGIVSNFRENEQRLFIEFVSGVCSGMFVVDHELQTYVPEALIVPRIVDITEWAVTAGEPAEVLRLVHAPTRRAAKGTEEILSAVEKLRSEGIPVELRLIENIPHHEAKELYKWADVVVDQLKIGWYGVLAVEAMALGKAVVCYIRDDLKHYLPYPFPLAIANPDNLYQVLKALADNPKEVHSLGLRGRQYVEELHDSEKVTGLLLQIYEADGSPFDVRKALGLLSFQSKKLVRRSSAAKKRGARSYMSRRNVISFLRVVRREGVFVALRKAYTRVFR